MQLEVEFESLAELEQFWAAVPPDAHRAWSQRAQVHPRFWPLSAQIIFKVFESQLEGTAWTPKLFSMLAPRKILSCAASEAYPLTRHCAPARCIRRMQTLVIDGSPRWEVYRTVPVEASAGASGADGAGAAGRSEPAQAVPAQFRVGAPVSRWKSRGYMQADAFSAGSACAC